MSARTSGQVRVVGTGLLGTSIGLGLAARCRRRPHRRVARRRSRLAIDYGAGRSGVRGRPARARRRGGAAGPDGRGRRRRAGRVAVGARHRCGEREERAPAPAARRGPAPTSSGTSARIRWPAASAAARSPPAPTSSSAAPGSSRRTRRARTEQAAVLEALALDLGATPVRMPRGAPRRRRRARLARPAARRQPARRAARRRARRTRPTSPGRACATPPASPPATRRSGCRSSARTRTASCRVLSDLRDDLDAVLERPRRSGAAGAPRAIAELLAARQRRGRSASRASTAPTSSSPPSWCIVDDTPGQLARLLGEIGELGVNLEDLRLEHSPGAPIGLAEIAGSRRRRRRRLEADLQRRADGGSAG